MLMHGTLRTWALHTVARTRRIASVVEAAICGSNGKVLSSQYLDSAHALRASLITTVIMIVIQEICINGC